MADPKSSGPVEELSPEQQKFLEQKQQQRAKDAAAGTAHQSDKGLHLKTSRQQKAEEKAAATKVTYAEPKPVTRREFLNYAWGAALAVVVAEVGISSFMYALPRFKEGEFGGVFNVGAASGLPAVEDAPLKNLDGQFWLSNDVDGVRALYRVCTHLGCLYEWKDQTFRFECPCHGSKFQKDGKYIEGPAPRSLDQFVVVLEANGQVIGQTTAGGEAVPVTDPNATILVKTGEKLNGPSH